MTITTANLDQKQAEYKAAVEQWIQAIREEEAMASGNHDEAEVDLWEGACFKEEEAREVAKKAKSAYESALRQKFFKF